MDKTTIFVKYTTDEFKDRIKKTVLDYDLVTKTCFYSINKYFIRKKPAGIVIESHDDVREIQVFLSSNRYLAGFPVVIVLQQNNWEAIRKCGNIGIDRVLKGQELHLVESTIYELAGYKGTEVKLKDIGIVKQDYLPNIREILEFIENNYHNLSKVKELAGFFNSSPEYLARKFKCYNLTNPKHILVYLKVRHALNLMETGQFRPGEIASLSGFKDDDYQQYGRWMSKIFGASPSAIQQRVQLMGSTQFWLTYGPDISGKNK